MSAETPSQAGVPRFTDAFDPVVLTSPRAAGPLTLAAGALAGLALASGLLVAPFLWWVAGLPLAVVGTSFAAIDLAHALIARRANWRWAVGAVVLNLATLAGMAWSVAWLTASWD